MFFGVIFRRRPRCRPGGGRSGLVWCCDDGAVTNPIAAPGSTWMLDLDGVLWLADHPVPGSGRSGEPAPHAGVQCHAFFTNNSFRPTCRPARQVPPVTASRSPPRTCSSGRPARGRHALGAGERAFVFGGGGIVEALRAHAASKSSTVATPPSDRRGRGRPRPGPRFPNALTVALCARSPAAPAWWRPTTTPPIRRRTDRSRAAARCSRRSPTPPAPPRSIAGKPYLAAAEARPRDDRQCLAHGGRPPPETDGAFAEAARRSLRTGPLGSDRSGSGPEGSARDLRRSGSRHAGRRPPRVCFQWEREFRATTSVTCSYGRTKRRTQAELEAVSRLGERAVRVVLEDDPVRSRACVARAVASR